jgi:hypothetical protein
MRDQHERRLFSLAKSRFGYTKDDGTTSKDGMPQRDTDFEEGVFPTLLRDEIWRPSLSLAACLVKQSLISDMSTMSDSEHGDVGCEMRY